MFVKVGNSWLNKNLIDNITLLGCFNNRYQINVSTAQTTEVVTFPSEDEANTFINSLVCDTSFGDVKSGDLKKQYFLSLPINDAIEQFFDLKVQQLLKDIAEANGFLKASDLLSLNKDLIASGVQNKTFTYLYLSTIYKDLRSLGFDVHF